MTLRTNQRRALDALLANGTIEAAAAAADVHRSTIHRWMSEDAEFARALADAERRAVDAIARNLVRAGSDAVATLRIALDADKTSDRIRAADTLLRRLIDVRRLETLENRMAQLESFLAELEEFAADDI